MPITLALFDMAATTVDDTINDRPLVLQSFEDSFNAAHVIVPWEVLNAQRGKDKMEVFRALLASHGGLQGDALEQTAQRLLEHFTAQLLRNVARLHEMPGATTAFRFLKQRGLTARQLLAPAPRKKFEAEFSNQIWQSDLLFGPYVQRPGGGRMQAFLYAVLDDASRLISHAEFYAEQGLHAFLDCLRQAVAARGIPVRLYVDNAKQFRSPQLARIAASIGMMVTHTPPYQPEGRGKIERFFRSVREQFLANLDPKRTLTLVELNDRLWAWLEQVYHVSEHSGLGTTPLLRWQRDIERIRQLPPSSDLRRLFFYRLNRLARRDSTFLLRGYFYEAPSHLAGKTIEVRFDPLDLSQVEIYFQGQAQGLGRLVDAVVNAKLPSCKPVPSPTPEPTGINFVELLRRKKRSGEDEGGG